MKKPVLIKRKILILDNNENILSVEYDALKIGYSKITTSLTDQKINQTKGIVQRLLSIWYDYLDTTTRDNALAPPGSLLQ
jgi:hypothetical protein